MLNQDFIERAFALADTGKYRGINGIRAVLAREGFTLRQLSQLRGKVLAKQIRARIAVARSMEKAG